MTIHCTGSLINREYVLTAAHCLDGFSDAKVRDLTLYLGLDDWSIYDPEDWFPVGFQAHIDETFIHPSYELPKHYFDVSLFKMDEKMFYSYEVQPICLPERPVNELAKRVGDSVTLAAFGGTDCTQTESGKGNVLRYTKLSATTLEVYSYQYCNDYIQQLGGTDRFPDGFISNILCVGSRVMSFCIFLHCKY